MNESKTVYKDRYFTVQRFDTERPNHKEYKYTLNTSDKMFKGFEFYVGRRVDRPTLEEYEAEHEAYEIQEDIKSAVVNMNIRFTSVMVNLQANYQPYGCDTVSVKKGKFEFTTQLFELFRGDGIIIDTSKEDGNTVMSLDRKAYSEEYVDTIFHKQEDVQ